MATNSALVKILLIYFGINLLLYAGGVRFTDTGVFGDLVNASNTNASITDTDTQYSVGGIAGNSPNVNVDNGSASVAFIDVLGAVRGFINFIIGMLAGVFVVFLVTPPAVQLFVGVPMALVMLIGIVYFARSGQ